VRIDVHEIIGRNNGPERDIGSITLSALAEASCARRRGKSQRTMDSVVPQSLLVLPLTSSHSPLSSPNYLMEKKHRLAREGKVAMNVSCIWSSWLSSSRRPPPVQKLHIMVKKRVIAVLTCRTYVYGKDPKPNHEITRRLYKAKTAAKASLWNDTLGEDDQMVVYLSGSIGYA